MRAGQWLSAGTAALLSTVLLCACRSASTRLFTPDESESANRAAYAGPPIRIDVVNVPPALDRIEVVSYVAPGELEIHDLDHWSAPLGQAARQVLTADMAARLPLGGVIFPHLSKPEGGLGIAVDILDLTSDSRGTSMQVSWVLTPTSAPVRSTGATLVLRTDLPSAGSAATARAFGALLGQLADRIVGDL